MITETPTTPPTTPPITAVALLSQKKTFQKERKDGTKTNY